MGQAVKFLSLVIIYLGYLEKILHCKGGQHWNRVPREVVELLCLAMFQKGVDVVPGDMGY